jgi:hypothetical protein
MPAGGSWHMVWAKAGDHARLCSLKHFDGKHEERRVAAPIVILTMRALIVMSLCTAMVAESAFAKQRFNPTECSQTAYSACLHDVGPYCRKDAASEPAEMRAVEYTACLARYRSTCREIQCD